MRKANERQVGGEHYKSTYQHWDWISAVKLPYLSATVTKYIVRWRQKNGAQDVSKSIHYIQKFFEEEEIRREEVISLTNHFITLNNIEDEEAAVIKNLILYSLGDIKYLATARVALERVLEKSQNKTQ